jgi:hypothetical protein
LLIVDPLLPSTGLGNMLLVWGKAVLFSEINNIPIVEPNWGKLKIGPFLRGERYKRYYGNIFHNDGYSNRTRYNLSKISQKNYIYDELPVIKIDKLNISCQLDCPGNHIFRYNRIPDSTHKFFAEIVNSQSIIKSKLFSSIKPKIIRSILSLPAPEIGIHIRLSDFSIPSTSNPFDHGINTRIPLEWYIQVLNSVRSVIGIEIPVTIFSDGHDHELTEILKLPNVARSPVNSAISDIITLSRSKLLIASSFSSFSMWATYLGCCPSIRHPAHFKEYPSVLPLTCRNSIFDGGFDPASMSIPDLLKSNLAEKW